MARTVTVDGAGEIRLGGAFKRTATLVADNGTTWEARRSGLRQTVSFADTAGGEPATFAPAGTFKRGGKLTVRDSDYTLSASSNWKERFALAQGDQELATIEAGGWTGTKIEVEVTGDVEPMVLLAACWLVRQFAEDTGAAVAATT